MLRQPPMPGSRQSGTRNGTDVHNAPALDAVLAKAPIAANMQNGGTARSVRLTPDLPDERLPSRFPGFAMAGVSVEPGRAQDAFVDIMLGAGHARERGSRYWTRRPCSLGAGRLPTWSRTVQPTCGSPPPDGRGRGLTSPSARRSAAILRAGLDRLHVRDASDLSRLAPATGHRRQGHC
jgi:hypothetical protein